MSSRCIALTGTGLSGLGDAPHLTASAADISLHFVERRDDVLIAAPFGYLGAIAVVPFTVHLARRLRRMSGGQAFAGFVESMPSDVLTSRS